MVMGLVRGYEMKIDLIMLGLIVLMTGGLIFASGFVSCLDKSLEELSEGHLHNSCSYGCDTMRDVMKEAPDHQLLELCINRCKDNYRLLAMNKGGE